MGEHTTLVDSYQFPGFHRPRYTQVPDDLFDELMPHLTGAELKVSLYIIRRTYGFKKDSDCISLAQLTDGITTRDGRTLDHGTGLARSTVVAAVKGLLAKGVIVADRNATAAGGDLATTYSLHERGEFENRTLEGPKIRLGGAGKSNPQETVQETEGKRADRRFDGPTQDVSTEDREQIGRYVADFRREFRDRAILGSSVARALNLYAASGATLERFVDAMQAARAATKAHSGTKKMAYWFACLEDQLMMSRPT